MIATNENKYVSSYWYDADGNRTVITNESGEVVQRVEYLPTGETFIEQQDTSWVSPTSSTDARPFGTLSKQRGERRSLTRCTAWTGTTPRLATMTTSSAASTRFLPKSMIYLGFV